MTEDTQDHYQFPSLKQRSYTQSTRIVATGSALPSTTVDNAQIIKQSGLMVTDAMVRKTIGVTERRVANPTAMDTDLLCEAAQNCLARAGIDPAQLSKLIVTKFVGDRVLPMTASLLQRRLGCSHAIHAFDVDGGANSFLHAFDIATASINRGDEFILIVSGGIHNRLISRIDSRHAFLYGDGAGAVLLGPSTSGGTQAIYHYSNPQFIDLALGFSLRKLQQQCLPGGDGGGPICLYETSNWMDAAPFIVQASRRTLDELLRATGWELGDIDLVLLTENSGWLRNRLCNELGIDPNRTLSVLAKYGNTFSAMLPLLLDEACAAGCLQDGTRLLALSVGEGLSGGGFLYEHRKDP